MSSLSMVPKSLSYLISLDSMTFLLFFISALFPCFIEASALPPLTQFTNTSSVHAPGPTATGCLPNCNRQTTNLNYISWSQLEITATYTAETLLLIVNNQSNSTRTSTVKNTEIDFANIATPTNTNSAGTVTTSISLDDGVTITATFPTTPFEDYASTYAFSGTLPTVVSGTSTCLTIVPGTSTSDFNSNNGVFTYPSHPPLPVGVQQSVDLSQDPRGWTFMAVIGETCDDELMIKPLFPDLGVWSCTGATECVGPVMALQTALYLTVTSTSHEAAPTTSSSPGPVAGPPASSLVSLLSSQPTLDVPSVSSPDQLSKQPAPYNPPTSAQSTSISPSPRVQPGSINQSAQDKQPAPTNSPSLIRTVPNKLPYSGQEAASNNQPAPAQSTSKIPLPVQQPAPKDEPVSNNQPSVPQAITSTNAQGIVILATSNTVPLPVIRISTHHQSEAITTTSRESSPVAHNPTTPPKALATSTITATNAEGVPTVLAATAAIIPIVAASTNLQGQVVVSSSLLFAAATASTNIVVSFTNAQGSLITSTTQVPAVIFTTTNGQGSQILTTLPILPTGTAFSTPPIITIGTQTITPNSQSQYIIGSQTLTPGGAITLSGTPISLAPSATVLVIGTSTQQLVTGAATLPILTTGTLTVSPNSLSQYIVSSQTLTPGGAITVSGTLISLAPSASAVIIGTNTQQLVTEAATLPTLSIGTVTVSPNSLSQYIVSSQTLTPGGIITLSGTPISLVPSATALIIGSNTISLGSSTILPPPLTIGSQVFTANSATQYIIGSQTLTPGGVITVSGTRVSLAPGDTAAVVGTSTEGLGALITAGLGSGPGNGNGNGNGTAQFTGGARGSGVSGLAVWLEGILMLLGLGIVIGL